MNGGLHPALLDGLARAAAVPPDTRNGDLGTAHLQNDLGIDSLALHQLVAHLERALAIEIPDEDAGNFITVTDIQAVLSRLTRPLKGNTP